MNKYDEDKKEFVLGTRICVLGTPSQTVNLAAVVQIVADYVVRRPVLGVSGVSAPTDLMSQRATANWVPITSVCIHLYLSAPLVVLKLI